MKPQYVDFDDNPKKEIKMVTKTSFTIVGITKLSSHSGNQKAEN